MITLILVSTFICIAGGVMALYWLLFRPVSATAQRLSDLDEARGVVAPSIEVSGMETLAARLAEPLNKLVPPSAAGAKKLQRELMQAGYRSPVAPAIYPATPIHRSVSTSRVWRFRFSSRETPCSPDPRAAAPRRNSISTRCGGSKMS